MDIYYEKHKPSGAWILTGIKDGYYTRQTYYGHNKREATRLFRQYLKSR